MDAGRDLIYGEGAGTITAAIGLVTQPAYDDIIFGDHGAVIQQVADPNQPDAAPAEDPDDAARLGARRSSRAPTRTAATTRLRQPRPRRPRRRRRQRHGSTATSRTTWSSATRSSCCAASSRRSSTASRRRTRPRCRTSRACASRRSAAGCSTAAPTGRTRVRHHRRRRTRAASCCSVIDGSRRAELPRSGQLRHRHAAARLAPWWAEYLVDFDDDFADADEFHSFAGRRAARRARAASATTTSPAARHNDLVFGQLGNDTIQGDGGIEDAFARTVDNSARPRSARRYVHVSASRTPDGCTGTPASTSSATSSATSTSSPSFEAATDGEDYIEGNGGNDIVFGGLGQDDIVGGSSDFFSLDAANVRDAPTATAPTCGRRRDLIFGGAGDRAGRNDDSDLGTGRPRPRPRRRHDRRRQRRIVRIVGIERRRRPGDGRDSTSRSTTTTTAR